MAKNKIPRSTIGSLGQLPFVCSSEKVLTFSQLSRQNSVRWATHDVIGDKPVMEFVGYGLSKVSLSIRLDMSLGVYPADALYRLERMLENKLYKTLIIGGEYLGRYVIESVDEERKYHDGNGTLIVAEAKLSLTEWRG